MRPCPKLRVEAWLEYRDIGEKTRKRINRHVHDTDCMEINGHCISAIHAEESLLLCSTVSQPEKATLVSTHTPCVNCVRLAYIVGIRKIEWITDYKPEKSIELMNLLGIKYDIYKHG